LQINKKALPLHPQSRDIRYQMTAARFFKKIFEKSFQKIWWFKNNHLSLHPLSSLKNDDRRKGS
jgi:hypothetical protein